MVYNRGLMKKIIAGVGFLGLFVTQVITSSAAYFNSAPIARCETQITRSLQVGQENNDVYVLQQMLANAGYLHAQPNGYFGYQTASAVRSFQYDNGIARTGTVGPATRDAINERLCDTDLIGNTGSYSYGDYGYSVGSTFVGETDPFVRVITPGTTNASIYATPQSFSSTVITPSYTTTPFSSLSPVHVSPVQNQLLPTFPANGSGYISSGFGYISNRPNYIAEPSTSITISSPIANSIYREGDTVLVNFGSATPGYQMATYSVLLENTNGGQSKTVGVTSGSPYSFVLTKELLDAVCVGSCTESQQTSFKVVIVLPTTDSYGDPSTFRAAIAPITIKRPTNVNGKVTLTTSKTLVNSGEAFKLYVNFPSTTWDSTLAANYTIKLKAVCTSSIAVTIGGLPCGQEYTVPQSLASQYQQEVSATIVNPMFYPQGVTFQVLVVNILGQVIGISETKVSVNSAPLGW